jgi:hypothetical protein
MDAVRPFDAPNVPGVTHLAIFCKQPAHGWIGGAIMPSALRFTVACRHAPAYRDESRKTAGDA